MNLRRLVATSALVIASMGLYAGTAYADPATTPPASEQTAPNIDWKSRVDAGGVVTTIDAGVFKVADDGKTVDLLDSNNKVVQTLPLSFNLNGISFPFQTTLTDEGRTITLLPNLSKGTPQVAPSDAGLPLVNAASPVENTKAQNNFTSQLGLASAIGGLTGTIVGGVVGLVGLAGGALALATVPTFAAIGGIIGTIVVGGPTLAIAGADFVGTLLAPPGTTVWNVPATP